MMASCPVNKERSQHLPTLPGTELLHYVDVHLSY